jgi:photosystem II stability/assembly factor-like uncharacterized protein
MHTLAGTSRGLFLVDGTGTRPVLDARGVRELVQLGDRIFAGTSNGVHVSEDGGATWRCLGIEGRAVWQVRGSADGALLYAAAEPTGLFRSRDGGASWTELDTLARVPGADTWCVPVEPRLPARARALVVDAADPRRLWVGVEVGGILRSTDEGDTWQLVLPGENPDIHMLAADPANPQRLYASTGYGRLDGIAPMLEGNAGVFRSDDGGVTWQYAWKGIVPRYSRPMCIDARAPHALTVASAPTAFSNVREEGGAQAMLFRSLDGGASWRSLCDAAHSPSAANFHGLAPHPSAPGDVVVGTDSGEVWHVTDDARWTQLAEGLPTVLAVLAVDVAAGAAA